MKRYASSTYLNDIPLLKKGNTLIKNLPLSNFPNDNTLKYRIPSFWFQQIQDEDPQIRIKAIIQSRSFIVLLNNEKIAECTRTFIALLKKENNLNALCALLSHLGHWAKKILSLDDKLLFEQTMEALIHKYQSLSTLNLSCSETTNYKRLQNKAISRFLKVFLKLSSGAASSQIEKILEFAMNNLSSIDCHVCLSSLTVIGSLFSIPASTVNSEDSSKNLLEIDIQKVLFEYTQGNDPRVRSAALRCLVQLKDRGLVYNPIYYPSVLHSLCDYYESVRMESMRLLRHYSIMYPNHHVCLRADGSVHGVECITQVNFLKEKVSEERSFLKDDVFSKLCNMVNDPNYRIRTFAFELLADFEAVAGELLIQTLDKKVMSHLKKRKSAHEERNESKLSINPEGDVEFNPDELILMNRDACGAFVLGLEDEISVVRSAAVEAIYKLSPLDKEFGRKAVDFLVDMFNDEIDEVRLKAIVCLSKMTNILEYSREQLNIILGVLEEERQFIRHACHKLIAVMELENLDCLKIVLNSIFVNLKKFPRDCHSLWKALSILGRKHSAFVELLFEYLLCIDRRFACTEPNVDDLDYVTKIIIIFNAAKENPTILSLCPSHTFKHYLYLKDQLPQFFSTDLCIKYLEFFEPILAPECAIQVPVVGFSENDESFESYLGRVDEKICALFNFEKPPNFDNLQRVFFMIFMSIKNSVKRFAQHSHLLHFYSTLLLSYHYLFKVLADFNKSFFVESSFTELLKSLIYKTHELETLFNGLSVEILIKIKSLRLFALFIFMSLTIKSFSPSEFDMLSSFLVKIESLKKETQQQAGESQELKFYDKWIQTVRDWSEFLMKRGHENNEKLFSFICNYFPPLITKVVCTSKVSCRNLLVRLPYSEKHAYPGQLPIVLQLEATFIDLLRPCDVFFQIEISDKSLLLVKPELHSFRASKSINKYKFLQEIQLQLISSTEHFQLAIRPVLKSASSNSEDFSVPESHVAFGEPYFLDVHPFPPAKNATVFGNR